MPTRRSLEGDNDVSPVPGLNRSSQQCLST